SKSTLLTTSPPRSSGPPRTDSTSRSRRTSRAATPFRTRRGSRAPTTRGSSTRCSPTRRTLDARSRPTVAVRRSPKPQARRQGAVADPTPAGHRPAEYHRPVFAERAQLAARELGDGEAVRRAPERSQVASGRPAVVGA